MRVLRLLLFYTLICLFSAACNPMKGRKAIVVDDDGRSMRFDRNRQESKNERWNGRKKSNWKNNTYKAKRSKRRN